MQNTATTTRLARTDVKASKIDTDGYGGNTYSVIIKATGETIGQVMRQSATPAGYYGAWIASGSTYGINTYSGTWADSQAEAIGIVLEKYNRNNG